jgi:hypothetical protein
VVGIHVPGRRRPDKVLPIAHAVGNDEGEITSADIYIDAPGAHLASRRRHACRAARAGRGRHRAVEGANPVVAATTRSSSRPGYQRSPTELAG